MWAINGGETDSGVKGSERSANGGLTPWAMHGWNNGMVMVVDRGPGRLGDGRARWTILTLRDNDDGRDAQEKNKGPGPSGLVRRLPATAVRAVPGLRGRRARFAPMSGVPTRNGRLLASGAVLPWSERVNTASIDIPHRTDPERSRSPQDPGLQSLKG